MIYEQLTGVIIRLAKSCTVSYYILRDRRHPFQRLYNVAHGKEVEFEKCQSLVQGIKNMNRTRNSANFFSHVCNGKKH